jgi:hypothetical protein
MSQRLLLNSSRETQFILSLSSSQLTLSPHSLMSNYRVLIRRADRKIIFRQHYDTRIDFVPSLPIAIPRRRNPT